MLNGIIAQAECLERSNSILYQKLERAQAFEARLQTDLAQLHKEVIAKGCENAHLCTVIARMRDQEVLFLDTSHHCPTNFFSSGQIQAAWQNYGQPRSAMGSCAAGYTSLHCPTRFVSSGQV